MQIEEKVLDKERENEYRPSVSYRKNWRLGKHTCRRWVDEI